jgi:hypothetical protein
MRGEVKLGLHSDLTLTLLTLTFTTATRWPPLSSPV